MTKLEEIKHLLESTGFPVAYHSFPEDDAPPMPYIVFLEPYSNNFSADGITYSQISHIQVELYTKFKEPEAEQKVESCLSSFFWNKSEFKIDSEKCYEIIYELEV